MSWVDWSKLTATQKREAAMSRPAWHLSDFRRFEFYVRKDGHVSQRRGGGSHQLSERACNEQLRELAGNERTKGDNREWKPGVTFHFSNR